MSQSNKNKRFVCFNINKRGRDGETLLHLCFSNVSRLHTELAKRMLKIFPKMIYDIKIGEEYYGWKIILSTFNY